MSALVRSEGLVLRTRAFRESSKIATVLTRRTGRIDLLALGARKPGSRFGAALEIGTEDSFIYYERETKTLWTLSSADILRSHQCLRENLATLTVLARILKLLYYLSQPGEVNNRLYNLTLAVLNALETSKAPDALHDLFIWRATVLSGYPPRIDDGCIVCGKSEAINFSVSQGGFVCSEHSQGEKNVFRLNIQERDILVRLSDVPVGEIKGKLSLTLSRLIRQYARYHLHADERLIPP
ncbi:DNA repair protein RecO [candidate division WOR-3 bacterium]|nr:DNA repair protein RecO [candidate division WOR-3 bacterium]